MRKRVIELRDQGQDFTKLFVDANGLVTGAWPFQGWVLAGFRLVQKRIRVGQRLRLRRTDLKGEITLKYPVVAIHNDLSR